MKIGGNLYSKLLKKSAMNDLNWLLIGSSGQLGQALSAELRKNQVSFYAPTSQELDITESGQVFNAINEIKPDVVVNMAAWTDVDNAESFPQQAHNLNCLGPSNLAKAVKMTNSILLHISTDYVFSGIALKPWDEKDSVCPATVYGNSKAAGEASILAEIPDRSYILRTAWLYSEYGSNFAKTMVQKALNSNESVRVVSDQTGQPTYAVDLAQRILTVISNKIPFGIYHGTNAGSTTWYDFAREIFKLSGGDSTRVFPISSNEINRKARRPEYSVLGQSNWAKAGLQTMRPWQVALEECIPEILRRREG